MKFFQIVPANTHFDFVGKFKIFGALSLLLSIGSIFLIFSKGFNFGIDFTGGTVVQAKFTEPQTTQGIREVVDQLGEVGASVVALGTEQREFLITVRTIRETTDHKPLDQRLVAKMGADKVEILQADIVGPKVGAELKTAAMRSLFYSIILIMIYIWFRFDIRFAPGATIAMIHDLLFISGFYILSGKEFTIAAVAALLTTAGYSVNDTIIIYDRVRELVKDGGDKLPLKDVINKAANLTLSRTILTSGLSALSIIPIVIFCTSELADFAEAMLIGLVVGTYSTIYIAAPFTLLFEKTIAKSDAKRGGRPVTAKL